MQQANRGRGRPPVASREQIEAAALDLFLHQGYGATGIAEIAAASGIGRTTFFRHYPSKSAIIWSAFDDHTRTLRRLLAEADDRAAVMTVVRSCVVEALRRSVDDRGIWLRRFVVLDASAELRAEALAHWVSWADAVAEYVAARTGDDGQDLRPASIGGAVQAAFLAALRGWRMSSQPAPELLAGLEQDLVPLCEVLQGWLDGT
ncbi:TetR/AcrR family transcriptional regulator [Streptomyces sp. NPDC005134]|uniref:TetR/AcrR family transcriptional regulator n=1 Tax=unclassified Streptomyces TaxID=2593676 RepID=UPI0033BD38BF